MPADIEPSPMTAMTDESSPRRSRATAKPRAALIEVAAWAAEELFEWLDAPVTRLASTDTPVGYSPPLEDYILPQQAHVEEAVRKLAAY
jgi:pyruvate/2-oxoglutarate/acetoin dehydrogenase E1 component